jgi:hypothetical protein
MKWGILHQNNYRKEDKINTKGRRPSMKKFRLISVLFLTLSGLLSVVLPARAIPGLPSTFTGTVTLNGSPVAAGTVVSAWINGYDCADATVVSIPPDMKYVLKVRTKDPDDPASVHCGVNGDTVIFHIGEIVANQTGIFESGSAPITLNLSATTSVCYSLTTNVNPGGIGTVGANPGANCSGGRYIPGTLVTLTANAGCGYAFSHWSGDLSGTTNPTSVSMSTDRSVTANFTLLNYQVYLPLIMH